MEGRRKSLNKQCEVFGEWAEISPRCNSDVGEDSNIKSERDGGALHKAYHGAIMRSPSSLDLSYTWSSSLSGSMDELAS